MTNKRTRYTHEFKLEAIKLITEHNRKLSDVSESLGIPTSTLDNWLRKYRNEKKGFFADTGNALTEEQREIQALRKQVQQLTMERDILKKASALLAQDNLNVFR